MAKQDVLNDVVALISDKGEQAQLRSLVEKYPVLAEGWMRQNDYDRNMNEAKEARKRELAEFEANQSRISEWQKWADENIPKFDSIKAERDAARAAEAELKRQLEERAQGKEGEVDAAQVEAKVKELISAQGYVTQEQITQLINAAATEREQKFREDFIGKTLPAAMEFTSVLGDLSMSYREEFKDSFDRKGFASHFASRGYKDDEVQKAYDDFVAEKRHEAQLKKAREDGAAEERAKLAAQNIPGSTSLPEDGPLNTFLRQQSPAAAPAQGQPAGDGIRLGDGAAARTAADELRRMAG